MKSAIRWVAAVTVVLSGLISLGIPIAGSASAGPSHGHSQAKEVYVCPACGMECDKLTFDKPGTCPECMLTLIKRGSSGEGRVIVLLFDGAEIIDYAGPWEVFGAAGFQVSTVAATKKPITAVYGQKVTPDYTFADCPKSDILLVPGGGFSTALATPGLISFVQSRAKQAKYVMSVCTGAFVLGRAGVLAGHAATTMAGMADGLKQFPNVEPIHGRRYVESGNILTTAGLSSGIDGALHLVSEIRGLGVAQSTALGLEYSWDPESKFSREALADHFLFYNLGDGMGSSNGAAAKLIETAGDTNHWAMKFLVSEPHTSAEIVELVHQRITARVHGPVQWSAGSGDASSSIWHFEDAQNRSWNGRAKVEPSPDGAGQFVVTLEVGVETTEAAAR